MLTSNALTLIVTAGTINTTTTVSNASAIYGAASVTLNATVSPASGPAVGVGTVTFTVKNGATTIGSVTSGTVTGGNASASFSLTGVNAGSYAIEAAYSGGTGFNASSDSTPATLDINKANPTCTISGYTGVYDGAAHGASGTCTGVGGPSDILTGLTLGASFTSVPGGTASWTFTDVSGNYNNTSGSAAIVISKATANCSSIVGYTGVYDGAAHGASGTCTGVGGPSDILTGLTPGASFTNVPGGTANWAFTDGTGNYENASGSVAIVIGRAAPTCSISGYSGIYDGAAHGVTGSCTGVGGPSDVLAGLNLGATFTNVPGGTSNWTFTDVTGNYTDDSGSVAIVISKATPDCSSIVGYSGIYDAGAHGATGTCTGVGGPADILAGLNLGASFTDVPGGTANWSFTDVTGNYNDDDGSVPIVFDKADPVCTIDGYTGVYDGAAHGATGSCLGVVGETLAGLDLGLDFTNFPGGTANWAFTDVTGNYNNASGSVAIVIDRANPTCSINGYTGIYDAAAHGATGSCTGVGGPSDVLAGLNLGPTFTNVPGGTANWTLTDVTGNYNNASGTAAIVIDKADATCTINGYSGIYDAAAHGATGSCLGVEGETLAGLILGASFTNVPGGTANWVFTDTTGNYNDDAGSVPILIDKANALCVVTGYNGTYDGFAHLATGACTGVEFETLAGLDLGASFTDVPGGTASWVFIDTTGNYNDDAGSVAIVITEATADCSSIVGYTGVYDGFAHGATGACTGVGGALDILTGLDLGADYTDVPGGTANWTFTDVTGNYTDDSGSVAIVITEADPTCSINGYTGTYDALAHGATGACTGVGGALDVLDGLDLGADYTDVPGGTATWVFTDVTGNYTDDSGSVAIVIGEADPVCTITGYSNTYDALPHGATGSCLGVLGETLAGLDLGASFMDVPGGTANWTFTDVTNNYTDDSGTAAIVIGQRSVTGLFTVPNKIFDGTTTASITSRSLTGVLPGDVVQLTGGTTAFPFASVGPYVLTLDRRQPDRRRCRELRPQHSRSRRPRRSCPGMRLAAASTSRSASRTRSSSRRRPSPGTDGDHHLELGQGRLHDPAQVQRLRRLRRADEPGGDRLVRGDQAQQLAERRDRRR